MPRYSTCARTNRVIQALIKAGWREVSRNRHIKLVSPCGRLCTTVSISPSDNRAFLNWLSDLRRSGVAVDEILESRGGRKGRRKKASA